MELNLINLFSNNSIYYDDNSCPVLHTEEYGIIELVLLVLGFGIAFSCVSVSGAVTSLHIFKSIRMASNIKQFLIVTPNTLLIRKFLQSIF